MGDNIICAGLSDPNEEPELRDLVGSFQIHGQI